MSSSKVTILLADEALRTLDVLAEREGRSRSQQIAYMAKNWDALNGRVGSAPHTAAKQLIEGIDTPVDYRLVVDPRVQAANSTFYIKKPDGVYDNAKARGVLWALPPPVLAVRQKDGSLKRSDAKAAKEGKDGKPPRVPDYLLADTDGDGVLHLMTMMNGKAHSCGSAVWVKHRRDGDRIVHIQEDLEWIGGDQSKIYARMSKFGTRWLDQQAYGANIGHLDELIEALKDQCAEGI